MNTPHTLELIAQHLVSLYDDRDDIENLARAANITLEDVFTGSDRAEFLYNILQKAHQEGKIDNLVMQAIAGHGDPAGKLRSAYIEYETTLEAQEPVTPNLLLSTFTPESSATPAPTESTSIHTEGGTYVEGNVDLNEGDFIGRDQNIYGDNIGRDKTAIPATASSLRC